MTAGAKPGPVEVMVAEPVALVVHGARDSADSLIRLAIEKDLDVEKLERLVALRNEERKYEAARAFSEAMARFAGECPNIKKSSTASIVTKGGTTFKYAYAELDEIARVIRPILQRCGLSYSFDSHTDGGLMTVVVTLRHIAGHSITASFVAPLDSQNPMSGAQKAGAALTYAKRQALASALGLTTTDEDTDGADHAKAATITAQQADDLRALAEEVHVKVERILKAAHVEKLEDVAAEHYPRIVATLEAKREKREAAK